MAMNVGDVMTRPAITVTPDTTILDAARLMLQKNISGLPVVDKAGALVGIVTEGDLLHRAETGTDRLRSRWFEVLVSPGRLARDYVHSHARKVGSVMSRDVASVLPQDDLARVVDLMESRRIKRLPVVEDGRLVGIVSRANLMRALVDTASQAVGGEADSDGELRARILVAIANQPWGPRASVDVTVKDGVAHLTGSITDDRERDALKILVENTPGITAVRDNLVWIEPVSGFVIPSDNAEPSTGG
jgi:CBS domain-containing protein